MTTSSDARNPVEALAEEFLDRKRRGEHPTLREYVDRHPDLAVEIRDLFPALLMMEDLGEDSGGTTGSLAAANGAALGTRLQRLGDYRILREIGRGGMGVVYEAEQESLGRHVALKVLLGHSRLDPQQTARFQREARAAAKLHHTNIVPVYGVGEQDGLHYYVMQFIQGLGLNEVLTEVRRLRQTRPASNQPAAAGEAKDVSAAAVARSLWTGRFSTGDKTTSEGSQPLDTPQDQGTDTFALTVPASPVHLPGQAEGRLQVGHAVVPAQFLMNEAPGGLEAEIAQRSAAIDQRWIVRYKHTPFAGRDVLVGIETEDADLAEGAAWPSPVGLAVHFSRVLDERQTVPPSDVQYGIHVCRQAVNVHHKNGAGARRDAALNLGHVHVPRDGVTVHENRLSTGTHYRGCRRNYGKRGHDNLVTRAETQGLDGHVERRRADGCIVIACCIHTKCGSTNRRIILASRIGVERQSSHRRVKPACGVHPQCPCARRRVVIAGCISLQGSCSDGRIKCTCRIRIRRLNAYGCIIQTV